MLFIRKCSIGVTAQVRDGKIAYLADPYGWDPKGATGKAAGR